MNHGEHEGHGEIQNRKSKIENSRAIVLFSHGSLLCGFGETLQRHAAELQSRGAAAMVRVGYLNYSPPLFLDSVRACVRNGATEILVVPYFLAPGYFVNVSLPKCIEEAQAQFPDVTFRMAEPIGYDARLADALITSAKQARTAEHWRDELKQAVRFCRNNPKCPLYETPDCPHTPQPSEAVA